MATKLAPATINRLKAIGIVAVTEESAREKMLKVLADNGIEGMESEDTETLIEMTESFVEETTTSEEPEAVEETTEEEVEQLAEEIEEEEKPKAKASAPASKQAPKPTSSATKPVAASKPAAPAAKPNAAPAKPTSSRGTKIDPKNNAEDRKCFDMFKKTFPEKDFLYAWVASAGVTIKFKGENSNRAAVLIENVSFKQDGKKSVSNCNLYLLTFTKKTEILDEKGIDHEICWNGAPMIKGITLEEALEIIDTVIDEIKGSIVKIDKKLGDNRKKMEDNLTKNSTKPKAAAKPKVEEEPEEELPEEPEEKPKAAAKPTVKAGSKK